MQTLEGQIVEILEASSKMANVMKTLPSADEYKDISAELNFKVIIQF